MYGSHDVRHVDFRGLMMVNEHPDFGASQLGIRGKVNDYLWSSVGVVYDIPRT